MKRIHTNILATIIALSSAIAFTETGEVGHAAHHAAEAAKQVEKPATMSMPHDMAEMKKMDMKDMSPEQCQKMIKAHHGDMKMDPKMMEGMKHCEMMKDSK